MKHEISNQDDVIDSRDIESRIEELEAELEDSELSAEDYEELQTLRALAKDGEEYSPDWNYGSTLIRDSYFVDYVQEMLEDCGDIPKDLPHYIHIDWESTARDVRVDYTPIEFDGVTYWVR